jgi:hypothetical protein
MKMKKTDIVLSAATVASAISALGHMHESGIEVEIPGSPGQFGDVSASAVAGSQAQRQIRSNIPHIANTVKLDGELLSTPYLQVADWRQTIHPYLTDSAVDGSGNYSAFGCYTNCHTACHGSRGWR